MKSWEELADEIKEWEMKSYGCHAENWQLFLGVVEESGEFMQARDLNNKEGMIDGLGDGAVFLTNLCSKVGVLVPDPVEWLNINTDYLLKSMATASHGILKSSLGIRKVTGAEVQTRIENFAHVWVAWAWRQTKMFALPPLLEITNEVWEKVRHRNWKANPDTGAITIPRVMMMVDSSGSPVQAPPVEPVGLEDTEPVEVDLENHW